MGVGPENPCWIDTSIHWRAEEPEESERVGCPGAMNRSLSLSFDIKGERRGERRTYMGENGYVWSVVFGRRR